MLVQRILAVIVVAEGQFSHTQHRSRHEPAVRAVTALVRQVTVVRGQLQKV